TFRKGKPDGIYGPETKAAVFQFQRESKLSPDGHAGHETWRVLDAFFSREVDPPAPQPPITDDAPLTINAFDSTFRSDPTLNAFMQQSVSDGFFKGEIFLECNSVADMVNQVLNEVQTRRRRIKRLFIMGHGAPGFQAVGGGLASTPEQALA